MLEKKFFSADCEQANDKISRDNLTTLIGSQKNGSFSCGMMMMMRNEPIKSCK